MSRLVTFLSCNTISRRFASIVWSVITSSSHIVVLPLTFMTFASYMFIVLVSTFTYRPVDVSSQLIVSPIFILVITFMQGIYSYIPETNHVSVVYSFASVLYLQFVLHVILFCPWNVFCTFTLALSVVCVQCPVGCFCSSLISSVPIMLLRYYPSDFEIVPVAPVVTSITFVFTFHMRWISIMRSSFFKISETHPASCTAGTGSFWG